MNTFALNKFDIIRFNMKYISIIFLIFISCRNENKLERIDINKPYRINKELDISFFHVSFMKTHNYPINISELTIQRFYDNLLQYSDISYFAMESFISNDTITILYRNPDCFVAYYINNGKYKLEMNYATDIGGSYPDGDKKYHGTFFSPTFVYENLVLKNEKKIKLNDTIIGYLEFETKPFRHWNNNRCIDKVSGPFVLKVEDISKKKPYFIP